MTKRLTLSACLAAALIAAPAPTAMAAATAQTYMVTIKGEQTTSWNYHGRTAGNCGGTTDGSGQQDFSFHSAPTRMTAAHGPGSTWVLGDALHLQATGSRTGSYVQSADDCDSAPSPMSTSGCGPASWTIDASLGHGLNHPLEQLTLDSGGAAVFGGCPWFEGPTDASFLNDDPVGMGNLRSSEGAGGLLFSFASLSSRTLARGRSFSVSKKTSHSYTSHDDYGDLHGTTTLRWTLQFTAQH